MENEPSTNEEEGLDVNRDQRYSFKDDATGRLMIRRDSNSFHERKNSDFGSVVEKMKQFAKESHEKREKRAEKAKEASPNAEEKGAVTELDEEERKAGLDPKARDLNQSDKGEKQRGNAIEESSAKLENEEEKSWSEYFEELKDVDWNEAFQNLQERDWSKDLKEITTSLKENIEEARHYAEQNCITH